MTILAAMLKPSQADSAALSVTDATVALCKASGDPLRLQVLRVLSRDAYGVLELSQIFDVRQSALSHHLKVLATAGLVVTRREGNSIFYRRALKSLMAETEALQAAIYATADRLELEAALQDRILTVRNERSQQSLEFFTRNSDQFESQQEQIVAYSLYGPATDELLLSQQAKGELAIEVGPGAGEFLEVLAQRYQRVIAIDNAEGMLSLARQRVKRQRLSNVDCRLGDLSDEEGELADCVGMNMVLHHVPSPAELMQAAAKKLKPGGVMSITELCAHEQDWAREACGDVWMGFEPEDLSRWAADCGLQAGAEQYLAQRNGFQVQLRHFLKRSTNDSLRAVH